MSATAELKGLRGEVLDLQHQFDRLTRLVDAKHDELDQAIAKVRREEARLEKIRSEIKRICAHFGVSPS